MQCTVLRNIPDSHLNKNSLCQIQKESKKCSVPKLPALFICIIIVIDVSLLDINK